jgi:histidine triad (HIT) family protein
MSDDCLFCKIARGEIPSEKVYSDDEFYAFRDIHPAAPVHVLVIPRKHIERISDATEADTVLMGKLLLVANKVADQEGIRESGFRYVISCNKDGGQLVFHIHLHIVGGRELGWPPG